MNVCNICNCIDSILIALAASEAMEHNAIVSKEARSIGINTQRLLSKDDYEELSLEHSWLEYPIKEPFAGLAFHIAMDTIKEKCNVAPDRVDFIIDTFHEARKNSEKEGKFMEAGDKFIGIKTDIMDIAQDLCKEEKNGRNNAKC